MTTDSSVLARFAVNGGSQARPAFLLLIALASWVMLAPAGARPAFAADPALEGDRAIAQLKRDGTYESLRETVTRARYAIRPADPRAASDGAPAYEAPNPAEGFRTSFTPTGVRLHAGGERPWQMGVELAGYGYEEHLLRLTPGTMQVQDNRVEITKQVVGGTRPAALVEWYVNGPRGLEQGFTLDAPPSLDETSKPTPSGRLRLVLQLTGDLHGQATDEGRAISLRDRDGRHVSTYAHLKAWDATGRELPSDMQVRGQEIALAIDDSGAVYPVTVDPTFGDKQFELIANDGSAFDNFGNAVAVSGNTAVVGAPDDDHDGTFQGSVYVFVRNGSTWVQQQKLTHNDDGIVGDQFGFSVAISGDTIVVGAPEVDFPRASGVGFDDNVGAAYVYVRSGPLWTLTPEQLKASDGGPGRRFGGSVAISDDTVIVGHNSAFTGAYVFVPSGATWVQQQILAGDGPPNQGTFGLTVAISGNTAMVSGDTGAGSGTPGSVYFFVRAGNTWTRQQKVLQPDHQPGDAFGLRAIALDGETAIVGFRNNSFGGNPADLRRNGAFVFVRSGGVWSQQAKLVAGATLTNTVNINPSVGISGNTAIVGFPEDSPQFQDRSGSVFVYVRTASTWRVAEHLSQGIAQDNFGVRVALSGDHAIIGTVGHDVGSNLNQGNAYLFARPSDLDGDALPDDWERDGITVNAAGRVVGTGNLAGQGTFIDLKAMGAQPLHKDIFIHADWMSPDPVRPAAIFQPLPQALKIAIDTFARAPVPNPDNKPGIRLHIDAGPNSIMSPGKKWGTTGPTQSKAGQVAFNVTIGANDPGTTNYNWSAIDTIKKDLFFGPAGRAPVFRYVLFANTYPSTTNGIVTSDSSGFTRNIIAIASGGSSIPPGTDFIVTLGHPGWKPAKPVIAKSIGTSQQQAGTFMHELGHTLGLRHGGLEDVPERKPNYLSVMNYTFQMIGLLNPNGQRGFDYSRFTLPQLVETSLNENVGIQDPALHRTLWKCPFPSGTVNDPYYRKFLPSSALDWDLDAVKDVATVSADINCSGTTGPLDGFTDWPALVYAGGRIGSGAGTGLAETMTTSHYEPSREQLLSAVPPDLLDEEAIAPQDIVIATPETGGAPLTVNFDGSPSTGVDGAVVVDWAWDFGDGTPTASGATVQHTYDTPGEYFASLTVTDDGGHVNLVPLLTLITVEEPVATPTRTATPIVTATSLLTPTVVATTTPGGPPIATPTTRSPPTSTPQSTAPSTAIPTPHPTASPVLGIGDVDPSFTATVASVYGKYVDAVVTQPDHKIIVGGEFASFAGCARRNIARVNADGSCDPTFDPGLALTAVHENQIPGAPQADPGTHRIDLVVKSLALQTDGKVLVGLLGYEGFRNGVLTHDRIIVRLNSDGTIDPSFDAVDVSIGFNSPQSVNTIVIQGDGKILIGGAFLYDNGKIRFGQPYLDGAIARLNSDGSVDSSFVVPDGSSFGGPTGGVYAIALQTDGRVIIGGGFSDVGFTQRYGIARLNGDGSFDAGYNAPIPATSGYASGFGFVTRVEALALLPDGKVLVGGGLRPTNQNPSGFVAVARLNADGSRDTGFVDWRQQGVRTLVRQTDGKILIGGDFRATDPVVRNSIARLDPDGGVDLTFDTPGMTGGVHQANSNQNEVSAIALQSDGRIVVVGRYDNFNHEPAENILQLATNGSRDPVFDSNGAGTIVQVYALARQPDGKLLVGYQPGGINRSTRLNAARRGGIGRLHADGTTDETFTSPFDANATVFDIVLQPDGKVLVGGFFRLSGSDQNRYFARLNADGTLDAGFVQPSLFPHLVELTGFALQADGKILVNEMNEFNSRRLARLDANGNPDETFSVELSGGAVEHIVVQPDGKLLVTGLVPINGLFARLARLNADGTPDPTFDPGSGPDEGVSSIVLQPDGKILVGGSFSNYDGTPRPQTARVNADGSLDTGFVPATPYTGFFQQVRALALAPDGKVLVGVDLAANGILDALRNRIFRLNADGSMDESFPRDGRGFERVNTFAYGGSIRALLLQPDESLLVGGLFDVVDDVARLGLVRLLGPTSAVPAGLDHFLFVKTKVTKGTPKFAPLGPLTLADAPSTTDVDVQKLVALGIPVAANDTDATDAQTHLADYALKVRKGGAKFRPLVDVRVENPCSDLVVTLKKPQRLLMPALVDPPPPGLPPSAASHEVADFRCYALKVQKKRSDGTRLAPFPKGIQLEADDGIASRRYDLKKLTRLCYPVAESGAPAVLKTGVPIVFTPAALRHATVHLACYQAKPATKTIAQQGCGPRDPKDKGAKIVPAPPKRQPRLGLQVASQLGSAMLDTVKDLEVCIPSTVTPP